MQSLWMVVAAVFYAVYGVCIKFASLEGIGAWEVLFYRSFFGLVVFFIMMHREGTSMRTQHPWAHAVRSLAGVGRHCGGDLFALAPQPRPCDDAQLHSSPLFGNLCRHLVAAASLPHQLGLDGKPCRGLCGRCHSARTHHPAGRIFCRGRRHRRGRFHGAGHGLCEAPRKLP